MLKRNKIIKSLIVANGYNENFVKELQKVFIENYLEKEKETLSETIDIFIDRVQSGEVIPKDFGYVYFGSIRKMSETDINSNSSLDLFFNFKSQLQEEYITIYSPLEWQDLWLVNFISYHPHKSDYKFHTIYIRQNDLFELLASKGINTNQFRIVVGDILFYPEYLGGVTQGDLFIDYNFLIALGNTQKEKEELVPKMKPKNN